MTLPFSMADQVVFGLILSTLRSRLNWRALLPRRTNIHCSGHFCNTSATELFQRYSVTFQRMTQWDQQLCQVSMSGIVRHPCQVYCSSLLPRVGYRTV
ncbi:hypothetical protein ID852_10555 [Xenorhabdus sp. 42]|uniref:hypothetical protein n=1 Tax=Xenorhabdus szentirmaii TaxID=290112 RepID=UPI001990F984|nr:MULTISPECIES: hypothetical protein [unclassified Xenorhabdus]MBD2791824.1 hypothetical protein [Xenorhabdus sp. CUL]MBD2821121.1 hypothetical protein [Xenorhabdus sp. 42]MBD2824581.1 hypothetical protein [Xenorhabdus sp. 5]